MIGIGRQPAQGSIALGNAVEQVCLEDCTLAAHSGKNSLLASLIGWHVHILLYFRQIDIDPQDIQRQLRLYAVAHTAYLRGAAYPAMRSEQLLTALLRHLVEMWLQHVKIIEDSLQEMPCFVRGDIGLCLRLQELLDGLAIVEPLRVARRAGKGDDLAVLGQEWSLLCAALRDDMEAQAHQ